MGGEGKRDDVVLTLGGVVVESQPVTVKRRKSQFESSREERKNEEGSQVGSSSGQLSAQSIDSRESEDSLLELSGSEGRDLGSRSDDGGPDGLRDEGGDVVGEERHGLLEERGLSGEGGGVEGRIDEGRVEGRGSVEGEEVGGESSDVRSGHGGSGDGVGGDVVGVPSRELRREEGRRVSSRGGNRVARELKLTMFNPGPKMSTH